ncbi:MAG TPA: hypothetical protein VGP26_17605 [Actinophytocola sp.]|nr:hypothetical protein [Actinophytocola sp.]
MDLGADPDLIQIVFGGMYKVLPGELVAVAPPGLEAFALDGGTGPRRKKVRRRRYDGQLSQGMFCSLDELGWCRGGPDEVAILRGLKPGMCLDTIPPYRRANHVSRPQCFQLLEVATTSTMSQLPLEATEPILAEQMIMEPGAGGTDLMVS